MVLLLHLVLKYQYYDAINRGDKKIEYRRNILWWRRQIIPNWDSNGGNKVVFHRGYTKTVMTFEIKDVVFNGDTIELHLGARQGDV
jgi:ASC-1-like (ASCH) protein